MIRQAQLLGARYGAARSNPDAVNALLRTAQSSCRALADSVRETLQKPQTLSMAYTYAFAKAARQSADDAFLAELYATK